MSVMEHIPQPVFFEMLGSSPAMERLRLQLERIGPHFRTILLTGETGAGKELAARTLHQLSPAANEPFLVYDPATTIEESLESAARGTLFLDEVGDTSSAVQAKLLRLMRMVDTRIIAATYRNLRHQAAIGEFRSDLYYRLSTVEIEVPPLRQRMEDLPLLVEHILFRAGERYHKPAMEISSEAMATLRSYSWPGNIRELESVLNNAVMQQEGIVIHTISLPEPESPAKADSLPVRLDDLISRHVRGVLAQCEGNKVRTAELLGISRSTLYRMLEA